MIVKKAYKVRLYPTTSQEKEMLKILAGCRFVWNYFLEKRQSQFLKKKKNTPYRVLSRELTKMLKNKKELVGLQRIPLEQSLRRLDLAYNRFFRKMSRFPRFKKEWDNRQSFQKCGDWKIIEDKIQIQKDLILKVRGVLPPKNIDKLCTVVVKHEASKWFASILVEENIKVPKKHSKPIGLDVGLTSLVVTSEGEKFNAFKPSYDAHPRMRALQQKMARQEIGSKRREQTRQEIGRLYQKLAFTRKDHIHKTTHAVLKKNPSMIAVEDLAVINMTKNHRLARSLMDVSLGELLRQLKYKQEWRGGEVVEIGRFYPSTKTCSKCEYINQEMNLGVRNWGCPRCGEKHDRDINAAKVILQQAIGRGTVSVEGARMPA